jgi:triosephosphate isomerase
MANNMKYFIGNWKMFGVPKSIKIISKINSYIKKHKFNKKYKVIIAPPFTLLETFSKKFKNTKISISAQNCYQKDYFSSDTGSISPYMIKNLGTKFVIIGHSDNRDQGDTDKIIKKKINIALKNNLKVIFCIGENKLQKQKRKTLAVLKKQIQGSLERKINKDNIVVAYEPIWSIGTGIVPNPNDLRKTVNYIKDEFRNIFKTKKTPPVLYGGSVDSQTIEIFLDISEIDGFLIGGASKSSKNFIDIIKNYYK